ncbi:MAG: choline/ethanolamine kinase family protein [Woeseiaceae bacterium]|nr:choline/ethanolamine kinase family protein [Woeseiaceae bacterium]
MTGVDRARVVMASIPGWAGRDVDITPLSGGLTNRTFLVNWGAERRVLRLAAEPDPAGIRDAELEVRIQQTAARHGLAAAIEYADPAARVLLTEWLPGTTWDAGALRDRANLRRIAGLLHRLHALPRCGVAYDATAAAQHYLDAIAEQGPVSDTARRCLRIIEEAPASHAPRCCHNDLVAGNIVVGERLALLDFEYARDNEPLFDLATLIGWHDLDERTARYLLDAYTGGADGTAHDRLAAERRRFDAIQYLWLAHRQGVQGGTDEARRLVVVAERLY